MRYTEVLLLYLMGQVLKFIVGSIRSILSVWCPIITKIYYSGFIYFRLIMMENGIVKEILDTLREYNEKKKQEHRIGWINRKQRVKWFH